MAVKSKTGIAKKKTIKPKNKEVSKDQGARFIETARSLGVDETGKKFNAAFSKAALKKRAS